MKPNNRASRCLKRKVRSPQNYLQTQHKQNQNPAPEYDSNMHTESGRTSVKTALERTQRVVCSRPDVQHPVLVSFYGMDPNTHHRGAGCFHNSHDTTSPVDTPCHASYYCSPWGAQLCATVHFSTPAVRTAPSDAMKAGQ